MKENSQVSKNKYRWDIIFISALLIFSAITLLIVYTTKEEGAKVETPGHTKGTISFFFDTVSDGKTYRVGMFGGAGVNTLAAGAFDYDGCRDGYRQSIKRLKAEKVDVFIGNHTWNNNTAKNAEILPFRCRKSGARRGGGRACTPLRRYTCALCARKKSLTLHPLLW